LLDVDDIPPKVRSHLLKALTHLSYKSGLYPDHLMLTAVDMTGGWVAGGAFADVWKGRLDSGHLISIKCPRIVRWQVKFLRSWSREIILWSQLTHLNVLPLYGIYHLENVKESPVGMVSPWMDHGNIQQFLSRGNEERINRCSLILDIGCGLEYLHKHSIVHGDLKSANILVTPSLHACIMDFGLAGVVATEIPINSSGSSSDQAGTPFFQAPEVLRRFSDPTKNTQASDMYSFACVCYEV
ncbi:kinase-like domain-containing protein, partial [Mycena floridula]